MEIKFTHQALYDVKEIYKYIARDSECNAKSVLARIEETVDYIGEFPKIGKKGIVNKTREAIVPKLPFVIVYQEKEDIIFVLTIFHTSKHPFKKIRIKNEKYSKK